MITQNCMAFLLQHGITNSATAAHWNGYWINTKKRNPAIPPSQKNSTLTNSQIINNRLLIF
jgi:hypothetical protein